MDISVTKMSPAGNTVDYDRLKELKAFDETKAGVKGVVDAGTVKVPKMFILPEDELKNESNRQRTQLKIPTIDMGGIGNGERRREIVDEVQQASEKWGFFQVVNHGIPVSELNRIMEALRLFHEQDVEVKKQLYTREPSKFVRFQSNYDLYKSKAANWRDTLNVSMLGSYDLDSINQVPAATREAIMDYSNQVTKLGDTLFELLSEALGLKPDRLKALGCASSRSFAGHYYPACPEPELTIGTSQHSDPAFLTVLLQDQISGLQLLHENQWVDVPPIPGALVVNIGDHLQIVSNDKFKSLDHRVLANRAGPRISIAFFFTGVIVPPKIYGPIKELLSEESPPIYGDFTIRDFMVWFQNRRLGDNTSSSLQSFFEKQPSGQ